MLEISALLKNIEVWFARTIYMERIMNDETEWYHNVDADEVEGPVNSVNGHEVV